MTRITISGKPGSGKSFLKDNLAKKLRYRNTISVGDIHGEMAMQRGLTINELMKLAKTDSSIHTEMDERTRQYGLEHGNSIIEGWIAYKFVPNSIRIFLDVDEKVGAKRIYEAQRPDEPKYSSIEDTLNQTRTRVKNTREGFQKAHSINFLDETQYDIVIDTTNKTPKKVLEIAERKIFDYNQKMNPPKFYFGHPTRAKDNQGLQRKIKEIGEKADITFFNPFKDNPAEKLNSLGEKEYANMEQQDKKSLAEGDLLAVLDKKIIGGIFVYNGDFTVATQMESITNFFAGKLNYIVTPQGEKEFLFHHPFFSRIQTEIFPNLDALGNHLIEKRNDLYIELRKSREAWNKDPITQALFEEMVANKMYLGR